MPNKVELNTLTQVVHKERAFLVALNENFLRLQQAINDTLSRTGVVPNQMEEVLDMNGKRIINVGAAVEETDALTKETISGLIAEVEAAVAQLDTLVEQAKRAIQIYAEENIYPRAEQAVRDAQGYAQNASQSAQASAQSAQNASQSAQAAAQSAALTQDLYDQLRVLKDNIAALLAIEEDLDNIDAVAGNATNINTVAGSIEDINSVADSLSAIQGILDNLTEIESVYNNIAAIVNVSNNMASVVSAVDNANKARVWAEGTDSEVEAYGGEKSSKGWAARAKEIVDSIGSVLHYKGSVETREDLPTLGQVIGDMYNILSDGSNVVWTGTGWDEISGVVDLSEYRKAAEQDIIDAGKVPTSRTINNKELTEDITLTASDVGALPDSTTIGNATLTIQKNGADVDTFTANATSDKTINITVPTQPSDIGAATSAQGALADSALQPNSPITGATKCKITYDSKGLVTAGSDLEANDIPSLTISKISDITATASELNVLDGITASTTELNYLDGVTSSIQTQLNGKQPTGNYVTTDTAQTINQAATKTFNGRVNFIGTGDANAIYLSTDTRIDVYGTNRTVLGFANGTYLINNAAYPLNLRGSGARPAWNGSSYLALTSDIGNATLTIQKNGVAVDTFKANATSDKTINITVPTNNNELTNGAGYQTSSDVASAISVETTNRENADIGLQQQIDAITASSDVKDIVGTYAQLQAYDTSTLGNNDIIKVLQDETHDNETTYYRWSTITETFTLIGEEGPYYTKSESDSTFVPQTRMVNNKALSSNITLTAGDVGALPDSTVIPTVNNATLTIQKNGSNVATFTANSSTNQTANITVPTDTSDLTNGAGFITGITSSMVTTALGYTPYNSTNPSGYQANVIETVKVNGTALTPSNKAVDITVPTNNNQLTNGAGYITSSALNGYATQTWVGQQGYLTSTALNGYATEQWVGQQGYLTGITSSDVTSALGYTPYNSSNPNGYTSNVGTVTSVNNVQPVNGNVTLSIPTDTADLTNGAGYITSSALSGYLTTSDIVSSVSSSSTNSKAVGAKLFYDTCGDIETLINAL